MLHILCSDILIRERAVVFETEHLQRNTSRYSFLPSSFSLICKSSEKQTRPSLLFVISTGDNPALVTIHMGNNQSKGVD